MAGIGFELRKAISRGGLGSFLKAAFSGIMIVAGPWIMSIIGITAIQRLMGFAVEEAPEHFMGVVIYSYAWSLFLFGGVQFIYTRIMADMLFEKREREAAGALVFFLVPTVVAAAAIAVASVVSFDVPVAYPLLFKVGSVVLFVSINATWLVMVFISLLKWYMRILFIYTTGMILSLLLVYLLGGAYGAAGGMAGYAAGQLGTAALLVLLSFTAHRPTRIGRNGRLFIRYVRKYGRLLVTGVVYYWGIWIDKMVFWFVRGETVPGTYISLFSDYDIAVYIANLSMIPGLVFFIVASETTFYVELRKFLVSLNRGTYAEIQHGKSAVLRGARDGLIDQSLFQGVVSIALVLLAPGIAGLFGVTTSTFRIVLCGVYLHLLLLTLINFHFYLEFYTAALVSALLFFLINFGGALTSLPGVPSLAPGLSYLIACGSAAVYAGATLFRSGRRIDRIILAGA